MSNKIKIKGKCPRCGSKLEICSLCYEFSYIDESEVTELCQYVQIIIVMNRVDMVVKSNIDGLIIGQ